MLDFLIFYEVKNREFESIVLLGDELKKRGYSVEYFSFFEYHNAIKRKKYFNKVKIAIVPSLYHDDEILRCVYSVTGKVKNIVNLRWEQVFQIWRDNDFKSYLYPKGNAKFAYHYCWGDHSAKRLLDSGIHKDNLFITGPLQMDVLRPEFRKYYKSKEKTFKEYGIDASQKTVLFISSFASSSASDELFEERIREYPPEEKLRSREWRVREKNTRTQILSWLVKLSSERACTVIYRPHPSEVESNEIINLSKNENIRVIREENVKQWIVTCDQVYTWFSTSIAEAYFAKIKCAVIRPIQINDNEEYSIYQGTKFLTTYDQFLDSFDLDDIDQKQSFVNEMAIKDNYDVCDSKPSFVRSADALEIAYKDSYFYPWNKFSKLQLKKYSRYYFKLDVKYKIAKFIVKFKCFPNSSIYLRSINFMNNVKEWNELIIQDNEFTELSKKFKDLFT